MLQQNWLFLIVISEKQGNWEKCLALWTQMQEDNIQPSAVFMGHLERILRKANQEVPFARSTSTTSSETESGLIGSETFHDALISRNMDKAEEVLKR